MQYSYSDVSGASPFWVGPLRVNESRKPGSGGPGVRHFYDGLGREIQTHTVVSTTFGGDPAARDVLVTRRYDARGLLISETVPYTVSAYVYNSQVNPYTTTNAAGAPRTLTAYDALGRTSVITAPDGTATRFVYENVVDNGRTLSVKNTFDANHHRVQYRSDVNGRLVKVAELTGNCTNWSGFPGFPCGGAYTTPWEAYADTRYTYDPLGHLRIVTDALTNTTVITYDVLGRKTGMRDPDMGAWRYQYDNAGNLITQTDALNQSLIFGYDNLNRLTGKWYSTTLALTKVATYTYDTGSVPTQKGYRTRLDDASGYTTWAYDARGRVVSETRSINGAGTYITQYGYDGLDRVISTTYPTGEVVTQTYNKQGAVAGVRQANGQWYAKSLAYNANGSLAKLGLGNDNATTTYAYYGLGGGAPAINSFRLWQVETKQGSTPWLKLQYQYDPVGNVKTITDVTNSGQVLAFTYDMLDRLTTAATTGVGSGRYSETYFYDPIGNLTNKSPGPYDYGYATAVTGCAAGTPSSKPHAVSDTGFFGLGVETGHFEYDCNGNMTLRREQGVTYHQTWTVENRLSTVSGNGQSVQYFYDGDGARVKKMENGQTTVYVGAIYEQNVSTGVTRTYYYAGSTRVAVREGATLTFIVGDHLGSASVILNSGGNKIGEMRYTPFGETRLITGSVPTDRRYTGQRQESVVLGSLYDYGARFYAPSLGRFVSADTIVPNFADPQSLNRFSYIYNNPIRYVDPTGHCGADVTSLGTVIEAAYDKCVGLRDQLEQKWGIDITGIWTLLEMDWLGDALQDFYRHIFAGSSTHWDKYIGNQSANPLKRIDRDRSDAYGNWLSGGYDKIEGKLSIRGQGFWENPLKEDIGLDYGTFFKKTIAHELGHALWYNKPGIEDTFKSGVNWGQVFGGTYTTVPEHASEYALRITERRDSDIGTVPNEDFAEYISLYVYRREFIRDFDYRATLNKILISVSPRIPGGHP